MMMMTSCSSSNKEDELKNENEMIDELLISLPTGSFWNDKIYKCKGFWCPSVILLGVISCEQKHFELAAADDIILASLPKSGTTWLKALIFSVVNRNRFKPENSPLLTANPHDLVPFLEVPGLANDHNLNAGGVLDDDQHPRVLSTHLHYPLLPPSVKDSKCRIVYVCRNPLDTLISYFHFQEMLPKDEANENVQPTLSSIHEAYFKYYEEKPEKVLFIKYEDLKEDVVSQLKLLAKFLMFPFTAKEEAQGLVEEIAKMCSLDNLKNLEVNKRGTLRKIKEIPTNSFFRKAEVGDYVNHLTPSMIENFEKLMQDKFGRSGLVFKASHKV
ncbi:hypothetical protein FNV43_RR25352 [Rhamnella rubrinervis]|uniref:Sulfotransferase n=1 Tax=Rhamnella rubrinervis TaxID=2594499 RepID=A0A8K0DU10_9ROSA|nr:hypothetical protein FNV43_RR25352 [Rhamnella rubrinervis]